jgi:hypothetical protein
MSVQDDTNWNESLSEKPAEMWLNLNLAVTCLSHLSRKLGCD